MRDFQFFVYILASAENSVLYVGVTNNLKRRIGEHKSHFKNSFTAHYNVDRLVYYETFDYIDDAIKREKQLKKWNRQWKNSLIETQNPHWNDLTPSL